ncbi:putative secreted protein (Por secretion system target) [Neolewinella xylanilytica]|uniref:Putative secreted protein (Por secretion system target) n=1 Tax=Neolewinella xylanilytica TaxID=1514080 RepID=A0A2S6I4A0_9BACT|nr:zinc-dependent metalloprotease [Neolewinella xylanilytica]PPK86005.1 putative secreted protein (Por secretion system target) [Neolewinella xylanilytica]
MSVRLPLLFVFSLGAFVSVFAQRTLPEQGCATVGRSPWIDAYQSGKIAPAPKSLELQYVPIRLTLLGDDGGLGYADPVTVLKSFELLNEDFARINVRFFVDGDIDYLNSTAYYDHDFSTGNELMRTYNRTNAVNNYIVGGAAGACGYYNSGSDGIVLDIDCINGIDRTWSHEVGHYFGLPHTFYGWESIGDIASVDAFDRPAPETLTINNRTVNVERVNQSNCAEAADGFCDTPPDYLPERWRCDEFGFYADSLLDPDSTRFAVSAKNIMSYAFDGCVEEFSPEQITAMNTNLVGRSGLTSSEVPAHAAARSEDLQLLSPSQGEVVDYANVVELKWNKVPNADFYLVQVNITFNFEGSVTSSFFTSDTSAIIRDILNPETRYYWRVRPINRYDVSGDFTAHNNFRNGTTISTATIDPALDAAISVSPNPVSSGSQLLVAGNHLGRGKVDLQLFDPTGRVVYERQGLQISGSLSAEVPVDGLSAGIYFLKLSVNGKLLTRRIVITP